MNAILSSSYLHSIEIAAWRNKTPSILKRLVSELAFGLVALQALCEILVFGLSALVLIALAAVKSQNKEKIMRKDILCSKTHLATLTFMRMLKHLIWNLGRGHLAAYSLQQDRLYIKITKPKEITKIIQELINFIENIEKYDGAEKKNTNLLEMATTYLQSNEAEFKKKRALCMQINHLIPAIPDINIGAIFDDIAKKLKRFYMVKNDLNTIGPIVQDIRLLGLYDLKWQLKKICGRIPD